MLSATPRRTFRDVSASDSRPRSPPASHVEATSAEVADGREPGPARSWIRLSLRRQNTIAPQKPRTPANTREHQESIKRAPSEHHRTPPNTKRTPSEQRVVARAIWLSTPNTKSTNEHQSNTNEHQKTPASTKRAPSEHQRGCTVARCCAPQTKSRILQVFSGSTKVPRRRTDSNVSNPRPKSQPRRRRRAKPNGPRTNASHQKKHPAR